MYLKAIGCRYAHSATEAETVRRMESRGEVATSRILRGHDRLTRQSRKTRDRNLLTHNFASLFGPLGQMVNGAVGIQAETFSILNKSPTPPPPNGIQK